MATASFALLCFHSELRTQIHPIIYSIATWFMKIVELGQKCDS